jgi:NAD(P)-dependent dehydrogenase (short-subunit alcohol dehydrogenase family)
MNAGVVTGQADITQLTDEQYRRILGINVDGVVFGVREAAKIMAEDAGGAIVCTASIAGLIAYSGDPIYALTKHAVVGLVRGLAPLLQPRGITINAICPGITETPLVGELAAARLKEAGFPLIAPEAIAEAVLRAVTGRGTGEAFVCQPDREPESYEFRGVPGPRTPGREGMRPPGPQA